MSVSYLGRLLDEGDYKRCLTEAFTLLEDGGHDAESMARIQAAICRSCLELTDHFAAVKAGQTAVEIARRAGVPDVLGPALIDLATALVAVRRFDEAMDAFEQFLAELPTFTAAQCMEGVALQRMGDTLRRAGRPEQALNAYWRAHRWMERFGDEAAAREVARSIIHLYLELGQPDVAIPLLVEADRYALNSPGDRRFLSEHLRTRALWHMARSEPELAANQAFQALEVADDRLEQQCSAHLLLCQTALAQDRPREALHFAMAARVTAIDGRLYALEFEASHLLFRLLRERGDRLFREVEADCYAQGLDLCQYLSERTLHQMFRTN